MTMCYLLRCRVLAPLVMLLAARFAVAGKTCDGEGCLESSTDISGKGGRALLQTVPKVLHPKALAQASPKVFHPEALTQAAPKVFHPEALAQARAHSGDAQRLAVDFVYCWGGSGCAKGPLDHEASCDNGELRTSLRSVARFAPWARKVFVLMDPPARPPAWFNTTDGLPAVEFVDRCALFDRSSDCPTQNHHACQSVMHRVPGLSEFFVVMDDDFYLISPAESLDYFAPDGRPWVPDHNERVPIYARPNPEIPGKTPLRINGLLHAPMGMLTSLLRWFEGEYPAWFHFVRSHKTRYEGGGDRLDETMTRIYDAQLLDQKAGVPSASFEDGFCEFKPGSEEGGFTCLRNKLGKAKYVNTNNVGTKEVWSTVQRLLESASGSTLIIRGGVDDAEVKRRLESANGGTLMVRAGFDDAELERILGSASDGSLMVRAGLDGAKPRPDEILDGIRAFLGQDE